MGTFSAFLADVILIVHTGVVLFIVASLVMIWIGYLRGWHFVRNFWFRLTHLGAMGYVAAQSILGADCPLTVWENRLRMAAGGSAYEESFVAHWLSRLLFYQVSETTFMIAYSLFFALVVVTWVKVKPHRGSDSNGQKRT